MPHVQTNSSLLRQVRDCLDYRFLDCLRAFHESDDPESLECHLIQAKTLLQVTENCQSPLVMEARASSILNFIQERHPDHVGLDQRFRQLLHDELKQVQNITQSRSGDSGAPGGNDSATSDSNAKLLQRVDIVLDFVEQQFQKECGPTDWPSRRHNLTALIQDVQDKVKHGILRTDDEK